MPSFKIMTEFFISFDKQKKTVTVLMMQKPEIRNLNDDLKIQTFGSETVVGKNINSRICSLLQLDEVCVKETNEREMFLLYSKKFWEKV